VFHEIVAVARMTFEDLLAASGSYALSVYDANKAVTQKVELLHV
jgi:hypothetical protein